MNYSILTKETGYSGTNGSRCVYFSTSLFCGNSLCCFCFPQFWTPRNNEYHCQYMTNFGNLTLFLCHASQMGTAKHTTLPISTVWEPPLVQLSWSHGQVHIDMVNRYGHCCNFRVQFNLCQIRCLWYVHMIQYVCGKERRKKKKLEKVDEIIRMRDSWQDTIILFLCSKVPSLKTGFFSNRKAISFIQNQL